MAAEINHFLIALFNFQIIKKCARAVFYALWRCVMYSIVISIDISSFALDAKVNKFVLCS